MATIEQRRALVKRALRDPALRNASARSIARAAGVSVGLVSKIRAASGPRPLRVVCFNGRTMNVDRIGRRERRRISFSVRRELAEAIERSPKGDFTTAIERAIERIASAAR